MVGWLDREYIEHAIRSKFKDPSLRIVKFKVSPALAKGENFASDIFRIKIDYVSINSPVEPLTTSYIMKACFEGNDKEIERKIFESFKVYDNELVMYDSILPRLMAILRSNGYKEKLIANIIKTDFSRKSILFEDLRLQDYIMPNKSSGFDMIHVRLILRSIARLHAASAKLNEIKPDVLPTFDRGIFNKYTDGLIPFYKMQLNACGRVVATWKGYERYGEKLLKLNLKDYAVNAYAAKADHFNVLAHGDLWNNNIMCKYNAENEPIRVVFLDFQFSYWTSPAVDLHYFIGTSVNDKIRQYHEQELIRYYYENLVDALRAVDFEGIAPSYEEFCDQYREKNFCAVIATCVLLPLILNEKHLSDDTTFLYINDISEDQKEIRNEIYRNQKIERILKRLLPIFEQRGILD